MDELRRYGGRAWQLPESNPAHIFRKNPERPRHATSTARPRTTTSSRTSTSRSTRAPRSIRARDRTSRSPASAASPARTATTSSTTSTATCGSTTTNAFSFTLWNSQRTRRSSVTLRRQGQHLHLGQHLLQQPEPGRPGVDRDEGPDACRTAATSTSATRRFGTLEYMDAFMYAENNFLRQQPERDRLGARDRPRQHDRRQPGPHQPRLRAGSTRS